MKNPDEKKLNLYKERLKKNGQYSITDALEDKNYRPTLKFTKIKHSNSPITGSTEYKNINENTF